MATIQQESETSRDASLRAFLIEIHAKCLWQQRVPNVGMLSCYAANSRVFITQTFERERHLVDGWEIFIPADMTGRIDATLNTVRDYIKS